MRVSAVCAMTVFDATPYNFITGNVMSRLQVPPKKKRPAYVRPEESRAWVSWFLSFTFPEDYPYLPRSAIWDNDAGYY